MRVSLRTGGTSGIAAAISVKPKEAGYKVPAIYAGNDEVATNFSKENKIDIFTWSIANELGAMDVLANNAGITREWYVP